jgi:LacI family transcriptional regulator
MRKGKFADIIDVAQVAGVSPATVSRAMNHPDLVKLDTRTRISKAMAKTGYIRNRAAQAIQGKKSGTIGLIVPTLDNAIFSNLIQAFSEQLHLDGFSMLVATHDYDLNKEFDLVRTLLGHRVEAVALIGLKHKDETITLLKKREVPMVTMWSFNNRSDVNCVGADNFAAGALIAQHLIDCGCRNLMTIFPDSNDNDRAEYRLRGALSVLEDCDYVSVPIHRQFVSKYSVAEARSVVAKMIEEGPLPDGILAGNDVIAQGAINACLAASIKVPEQIQVTGIGDFSNASDSFPSITTVRLRSNLVGKMAAEALVKRVHEPNDEVIRISTPIALKQRESTCVTTSKLRV